MHRSNFIFLTYRQKSTLIKWINSEYVSNGIAYTVDNPKEKKTKIKIKPSNQITQKPNHIDLWSSVNRYSLINESLDCHVYKN